MKNLFISISLLVASFGCLTCTDSDNPRPAQVLVTVTGECVCNVFIYTPDGLCLQSKIWDCQETQVLKFDLFYEGALIIKAEYKDKTVSKSITTQFGKTTETGIIFLNP
jgi:hypothetical protein